MPQKYIQTSVGSTFQFNHTFNSKWLVISGFEI
jgi:hypothetical protein